MTDTVKTATPTPMSKTSPKMGTIRRALKGMGFKQIILNQSKGKEFNNTLRGKVTKDYVEFFSIPDIKRQSDNPNVKHLKTFGFNYNYLDREVENHTAEVNFQEKTSTYDETEKKFNNHIERLFQSPEIPLKVFQEMLSTLIVTIDTTNNPDEVLEKAKTIFGLKEVNKEQIVNKEQSKTPKP